jgi:hypothetical protein
MLADGLTKMKADTTLLRMVVSGTPYGLKEDKQNLKEKAGEIARVVSEKKEQVQAMKTLKEKRKEKRQATIRDK